ncbi:nicotinate-nucleotide adenylyltransferase [Formosa agariphila KMM 3901]|uniref:Probable nicotinate-nucleotide adenylyltransferase n=1 Tax=Formosa agariphila (strain DSM 15362 / KCTC 12365 / LMG 23005 / KMM 3901 / M-2Alg 35-1) TaxID=1347342 RepID=T2KRI7_FORAG|nr:nicotinate (nicotinamide) nucleotide adenylyltransferase [Formosa agariphila]CDF81076.1 nicotinate-nucleotide adenylyltransferase [Formosa agariphila KMM 3901]
MKIGLYFGTFNPIHIGHLVIANHMAEYSDLDQIWLVVTPHNPFKKKSTLLNNHDRLEMVYQATKDYEKLEASDIEFNLPQPSYTINTLTYLLEKHPKHEFSLIMGEDNLKGFHKWKNNDIILENHDIYVYPRISEGKTENQLLNHPKIHRIDAPIMEISSTFIRQAVRDGKSCKPLLPEYVWTYIDEMNFYK